MLKMQISLEAISLFLLVGLSFSLLLLAKNLFSSKSLAPVNSVPLALIFIFTLELFYGWLYGSKYMLTQPHLLRLNTPFVFLVGPLLYWMMQVLNRPGRRWRGADGWHLLPFVLAVIYLFPLYISSGLVKARYVEAMYTSLSFDSLLLGGIRRVQQALYLAASIVYIQRNSNSLYIQRAFNIAVFLVAVVGLLWGISVIRYFFSFDLLSAMADALIMSLVAVVLTYQQLTLKPVLPGSFHSDVGELQGIIGQIEQLFAREKVYLNPKFSLKELSGRVELPPAKVSRALNRVKRQNFNEFVNAYKVAEAKKLLQSTDTSHLTIEAIASMAGFNSSSSFNSNFKRVTGKSPKAYRV